MGGDLQKKAAVTTAVYPSSNKAKKNWNEIEKDAEKELEGEKPEGDEALNKLFKDIYGNASEETRRAMIKSFQTSGGTAQLLQPVGCPAADRPAPCCGVSCYASRLLPSQCRSVPPPSFFRERQGSSATVILGGVPPFFSRPQPAAMPFSTALGSTAPPEPAPRNPWHPRIFFFLGLAKHPFLLIAPLSDSSKKTASDLWPK